jgi:hypothetical protein
MKLRALLVTICVLLAIGQLPFSVPVESARRESFPSFIAKDTKREMLVESLRKMYRDNEVQISKLTNSEKGDAASGTIGRETNDEITLDTTPCSKEKVLISLHPIYKKSAIKDITCPNGKTYSRLKVTQQ